MVKIGFKINIKICQEKILNFIWKRFDNGKLHSFNNLMDG